MHSQTLEWITLPNGDCVVASGEHAWHRPGPVLSSDPFASPMQGPGSVASTRRLLEAVVGAAFQSRQSRSTRAEVRLTIDRYVWRLIEYYQASHFTAVVLEKAYEVFSREGRSELATYVLDKQQEEAGHDILALRDIEALGFDAEGLVAACRPSRAVALTAHMGATVAVDPVALLGCEYAIERTALAVQATYVDAVRAQLAIGNDAIRCLRVHSATGPEAAHVDEAIALIASLPAADRIRIAASCYDTIRVIFAPREDETPSDGELGRLLAPFRRARPNPTHQREQANVQ